MYSPPRPLAIGKFLPQAAMGWRKCIIYETGSDFPGANGRTLFSTVFDELI
jgi:hypothetical protein